MEFQTKDFFKEYDDPEVSGFTIIEEDDDSVRLAEKWERPTGAAWTVYWVSKERLRGRCEAGSCGRKGQVSDEQFEQICKKTDKRALTA